MKNIKKYIKKIPAKKLKMVEAEIHTYINSLQKESKIDLDMPLKDFILSRR